MLRYVYIMCMWYHQYQTVGTFRLCDVFRAFSFSVIIRAAANAMLPVSQSVRPVPSLVECPFCPHEVTITNQRPKAASVQTDGCIFERGSTRLAESFREMQVEERGGDRARAPHDMLTIIVLMVGNVTFSKCNFTQEN